MDSGRRKMESNKKIKNTVVHLARAGQFGAGKRTEGCKLQKGGKTWDRQEGRGRPEGDQGENKENRYTRPEELKTHSDVLFLVISLP